MVSIEIILLLQQKVESAVQKIEQLKSENDALRAERSELTKALSEKSELLSRFSADEKRIEDGILGALSRLDSVENAILDASAEGGEQNKTEEAAFASASPAPQETPPAQAEELSGQATLAAPAQEAAAQTPQESAAAEQAAPVQNDSPARAEPNPILGDLQDGGEDDLFGDTSFQTEEGEPDIF